MRFILLGAAALILAACATNTASQAETAAPQAAVASATETGMTVASNDSAAASSRMRCENIQVLGSRRPAKRVCQTEEQWARQQENSQEIVRTIERMQNPGDPNN